MDNYQNLKIFIILIISFLAVIIVPRYLEENIFKTNIQNTPSPTLIEQNNNIDIQVNQANTKPWKTYMNNKVGFSLDYPSDWTLAEPTTEILQVSFYPPGSDPKLPSSSINLGLLDQTYLPQPSPQLCMTQYEQFFTNSGLEGRRSEDLPLSNTCLPRTGGCVPISYVEIPVKNKTLNISYCLVDKERFEEVIKTLKIIE